ncbi:MAG: hypothetical protein ACRDTG_19065 [Pseudonocardiaceae bacterium]
MQAPIRKVKAGAVAGFSSTMTVLLMELIPGLGLPAPVAAALTVIATLAAAYGAHSAPGEASPPPTLPDRHV